jgi:hypothetical protein
LIKDSAFPTFFILGRITINFDVLSLEVLKMGLDAPLVIFGVMWLQSHQPHFANFPFEQMVHGKL